MQLKSPPPQALSPGRPSTCVSGFQEGVASGRRVHDDLEKERGTAPDRLAEGQLQHAGVEPGGGGPVRTRPPTLPKRGSTETMQAEPGSGSRLGVDEPRTPQSAACAPAQHLAGGMAPGRGMFRKLVCADWCGFPLPLLGAPEGWGPPQTLISAPCPALPRPAALPLLTRPLSTPWGQSSIPRVDKDTKDSGAASSHWGAACPPGPGRAQHCG